MNGEKPKRIIKITMAQLRRITMLHQALKPKRFPDYGNFTFDEAEAYIEKLTDKLIKLAAEKAPGRL